LERQFPRWAWNFLCPFGGVAHHVHADFAGLVIPGGESTVMGLLSQVDGFLNELGQFAAKFPILGTCAGLILLADHIVGSSNTNARWARNSFVFLGPANSL
jgi:glutamine amidotransferase PdxT